MTTQTFTFRQLEADPTLCKGMKRLWQDSEGKTVAFSVPDASDATMAAYDGEIATTKQAHTPKPKAKGKKK